ncbi:MAG: matrixin family metalloprotease [Bdellovibrionales bacterium]|nr:matrixin family metalloprotease [Bdellovibrionales bacterium]
MKIIYMLVLFVVLSSCTKNEENKPPAQEQEVYYVQGDPINLVEGTTLSDELPFKIDNLEQFKDSYIVSSVYFTEKVKEKKYSTSEEGRESRKSVYKPKKGALFSFKKYSSESGDSYGFESDDPDQWRFGFEIDSSGKLYRLRKPNGFQILHVSITPDKKYFNFLIYSNKDKDSKYLVSITFTTDPINEDIFVSDKNREQYYYLRGPGVIFNWPQKVNLDLCYGGYNSKVLLKRVTEAAQMWNTAIGENIIQVNLKKNYPPFSDLNSRCVYLNKSFLKNRSGATTFPIFKMAENHFLDSDIFLWDGHLANKYFTSFLQDKNKLEKLDLLAAVKSTIIHELGHFLGLGHNFDYGVNTSIMGYKEDYVELQPYDIEAIRALYRR